MFAKWNAVQAVGVMSFGEFVCLLLLVTLTFECVSIKAVPQSEADQDIDRDKVFFKVFSLNGTKVQTQHISLRFVDPKLKLY